MAAASLLALIDDIATILDDVALMSKVAAKKTAGVLGDDLALNAQQVTGVRAERELPVVWAVARGSLLNKAILVPAALAISAFVPWAVTPLLMAGGAFLCFEGAEKLAHRFLHGTDEDDAAHHSSLKQALVDPQADLLALERDKIKGAVRTDFILSSEIIAIAHDPRRGVAAHSPVAGVSRGEDRVPGIPRIAQDALHRARVPWPLGRHRTLRQTLPRPGLIPLPH